MLQQLYLGDGKGSGDDVEVDSRPEDCSRAECSHGLGLDRVELHGQGGSDPGWHVGVRHVAQKIRRPTLLLDESDTTEIPGDFFHERGVTFTEQGDGLVQPRMWCPAEDVAGELEYLCIVKRRNLDLVEKPLA